MVMGLTTAALSWLAQIIGIHWTLHAYGIETGIGVAGLVFLASTLVGLFPIVPGNVVVFQGATVAALTFATNVSADAALTFSIGLALIEAALGVGLGILLPLLRGALAGRAAQGGGGVGEPQRPLVERTADHDRVGAGGGGRRHVSESRRSRRPPAAGRAPRAAAAGAAGCRAPGRCRRGRSP